MEHHAHGEESWELRAVLGEHGSGDGPPPLLVVEEKKGEEAALRHLLTHAARGEEAETLALLDEHPALINQAWTGGRFSIDRFKDDDVLKGDTVLMAAAESGSVALTRSLLDRKADCHARAAAGWDALYLSALHGHLLVAKLLLERGADPNATNAHYSALRQAAQGDHFDLCALLLKRGADLTAVCRGGRTALGVYGEWAKPQLTEEQLTERRAALHALWEAGPHPSQVQRRRDEKWARRSAFMQVLAESDLQPLAARRAELALLPPAPAPAAPAAVPAQTPQQARALLLSEVLSHPAIVKRVAAFL